jgi:prepilin-type N-terminal cleavage/methylation domain-containing protein
MSFKKNNQKGFTLVEILIVISLIAVLSGVTLGVVNSQQKRKAAEDAVKRSGIEKIYLGLEGYFSAEGKYPTGPDDPTLAYYMRWPSEPSGVVYNYIYNDGEPFVYVEKSSTGPYHIYKYYTGWSGPKECTELSDMTNPSSCLEPPSGPAPPSTFAVNISKIGEGDVRDEVHGDIDCGSICTGIYAPNTSIVLGASPRSGFMFGSWSGVSCDEGSGSSTCSFIVNSNMNITATFVSAPPPTYTLTVTKNPSEGGAVTSNPNGINCGSTCQHAFNEGTSVTLNAVAASGYVFSNWSGACSGSGTCTVNMTSNRSVTAVFSSSSGDRFCRNHNDCRSFMCAGGSPMCDRDTGQCYCSGGDDIM